MVHSSGPGVFSDGSVIPNAGSGNVRLGDFIRENTEPIAREWTSFAKTMTPASDAMTPLALRDHIVEMLRFISDDLESPQTGREQTEKAHGDGPEEEGTRYSAAEIHAGLRLEDRFDIDQVVAEYRALRASVVKLWQAARHDLCNATDLRDTIRFNEAIDQVTAESVRHYTKTIDHSRNLFLGILGHDLRSPIGAASACAQLMVKGGTLGVTQAGQASLIVRTTTRANQIVTDLLDLTRSGFGSELPVTKDYMDMALVSRDLVDEMQALHLSRRITLKITGDMEGDWDIIRIGQIFSNLIGNAIQYSFRDTPIDVTVKGEPDEIILSVRNEGHPIPPEKVGRIFDELTRGAGEEGSANLGLGLYITKRVVESHKGSINVSSSEEDGTRFTVRLPRH